MMASTTEKGDLKRKISREAYTVDEVARLLGVGRAAAYTAVRLGQLPAVRVGRLVRIPRRAFERWLDKIEDNVFAQQGGR